jgi:hypothetical protein
MKLFVIFSIIAAFFTVQAAADAEKITHKVRSF